MSREKPDYGYDAPGVMLGLLAAGGALVALGAAVALVAPSGWLALLAPPVLILAGLVPLIFGLLMLAYVHIGKMRVREAMLDMASWAGDEQVLDIGTGAGLLLVGAAKRLTTGRAIGIDLWSSKDLSNNGQAVTERNARIEGVADRVAIETADARELPFADGEFDRVVSLLCLHNIEGASDREQACFESARVLKPGGTAIIGDYVPTSAYADAFRRAGVIVRFSRPYFRTALSLMWLVVAEKPR